MDLITPSGGLLFWMVLIFGVVFFLLAKYGFPVITSMVNKRKDFINESLMKAQEACRQIEGTEENCRKLLEEARQEQGRLIEQARVSAHGIVEDAKAQASVEAAGILAKARSDIEQQKQEAVIELQNVVTELSLAVSERLLREKLSDDRSQAEYAGRLVEEIRKQDMN